MFPQIPGLPDRNYGADQWGPLVDIPEEYLVQLALRISNYNLQRPSHDAKLVTTIRGSHNLVHIIKLDGCKMVIRIPDYGWRIWQNPEMALVLPSEAATMRFIRRKTSIPVPEIYNLDMTKDNEIGAPYLCMSFVSGKPVSEVWFDGIGTVALEELRLSILTSLSKVMAQFSVLTFDKLGSVVEDADRSTSIGPVYDYLEDSCGWMAEVSGPFDCASAYIKHHYFPGFNPTPCTRGGDKIMHAVLPQLDAPKGFIFCPATCFGPGNVMVDLDGNVTGLIDWTTAQTMPKYVRQARYPSRITRDWNPLVPDGKGWNDKKSPQQDSPQALEAYRAHYDKDLHQVLSEHDDRASTESLHALKALWIAFMYHTGYRPAICRKLVEAAMGEDADAPQVLHNIGSNKYSEKDWTELKSRINALFH